MDQNDPPLNVLICEGVRCRVIGGKKLVTYQDAADYTGHTVGTITKKVSVLGLKTYRIGRYSAIEKADADRLVVGGAA